MMINETLKDYVDKAKSGDHIPGGGSVAGLVGSLGAALTVMVGNLTIDKKSYRELDEDKRKLMDESFKKLNQLIDELNSVVDDDTKVFDGVMQAYKLPKETDEEKKVRAKAIEDGYKVALSVPLKCAKTSLEGLRLQDVFANYGNLGALTDVGIGTLLLYSALESSLMNVSINLLSIKDVEYVDNMKKEMREILAEAQSLRDQMLDIVYTRLDIKL